jgi:hypothetical protein
VAYWPCPLGCLSRWIRNCFLSDRNKIMFRSRPPRSGDAVSQWNDRTDEIRSQLVPHHGAGRCRSRSHRLLMDRPLRHYSKAAGISVQAREILLSDMPSLNGSIALTIHQSSWCYHTYQRRTAFGITISQRDTLRKSVPKPPMLPRYCQENTALVSLLF